MLAASRGTKLEHGALSVGGTEEKRVLVVMLHSESPWWECSRSLPRTAMQALVPAFLTLAIETRMS